MHLGILGGLVAVDAFIVVGLFLLLKSQPLASRKQMLTSVVVGTAGFIFHAFMFFSGPFLVIQLAMIASLWASAWYLSSETRDKSL
jgi:hypothetical protein